MHVIIKIYVRLDSLLFILKRVSGAECVALISRTVALVSGRECNLPAFTHHFEKFEEVFHFILLWAKPACSASPTRQLTSKDHHKASEFQTGSKVASSGPQIELSSLKYYIVGSKICNQKICKSVLLIFLFNTSENRLVIINEIFDFVQ